MFYKQGTPTPFTVFSLGTCEICGQKPAVTTINGRKVCDECKQKAVSEEQ